MIAVTSVLLADVALPPVMSVGTPLGLVVLAALASAALAGFIVMHRRKWPTKLALGIPLLVAAVIYVGIVAYSKTVDEEREKERQQWNYKRYLERMRQVETDATKPPAPN